MALLFDKRIEFTEYVDGGGPEAHSGSYEVVAKAWAAIKTMTGKEIQALGLSDIQHTSRFIIKYQKGLNKHMQVRYKGKDYDIQSIMNDDEQNNTITIIADTHD